MRQAKRPFQGNFPVFAIPILLMLLFVRGVHAEFKDGMTAYENRDFVRAVRIWRPLAESGEPTAQYGMGIAHLNGEGVPRNYATALRWFRDAARQNHAQAQVKLGRMHVLGLGVTADTAAALDWFRKAAGNGEVQGQLHLGEAYYLGRGVPRDLSQAEYWFHAAAMQGSPLGQYLLGTLYDGEDHAVAVHWYRKAALQGYAPAQRELAGAFRDGRGVPKNLVRAYMWYDLSAMQGDEEARAFVAELAREMAPAEITEAKGRAEYWRSNWKTRH